jgi:uncharacterized protein (DUF305 family)
VTAVHRAGPGINVPLLAAAAPHCPLRPSCASTRVAFLAALLAWPAPAALAQAPIIQPGAPGQPSRPISAEQAIELARTRHSAADTRFMQDMIPHHHHALEMAALVAERTSRGDLIELAGRIQATQSDEIRFMEGWLRERGEPTPDPAEQAAMHTEHHMAGIASAEDMARLAAARGSEFDALFLELMIRHHRGALTMVDRLLEQSGSAQDPQLFEFTTEVKNEQSAEIDRMAALLTGLSPDPRVGLAAGLHDAGMALSNMRLVAALPKPPGFFDPDNPAGLPQARLRALEGREDAVDVDDADAIDDGDDESDDDSANENGDDREREPRRPLLAFANTDLAFAGDLLVAGNYHGFKLYDLANPEAPDLISAVVCPGGQGDVSVVGDLLILSVEETRGRLDCGLMGVVGDVSEERFRGLRIFDISNRKMPLQVGAVQTCRGSHTHTVVAGPGDDGRIIVYNSGLSAVRDEDELDGCIDESPWRDERTALFRIDVIEIPVERPQEARVVASPAVFADPDTGILAGLWEGGDHGPETQRTSATNHCHDITVFPELGIAAGACSGNGILFDISDPLDPVRIDDVVDTGFAYWHSATFNNDGTKVIFTDEWGGGVRPRCRAFDPRNWGANAIYDIVDGRLAARGYYKMPAPQTEQENCVAHNGSLVPVPGRDILVQAWYQGGISVFDFTDSANPVEIAFFDRGPVDEEALLLAGHWSAYWYRGLIYATEIVRGLDVLALTPSEYLSENEIAAAALYEAPETFNPQQQFRVGWPAEPVVARAYRDQLVRSNSLGNALLATLDGALDLAESASRTGDRDRELARTLDSTATALDRQARRAGAATRMRLAALSEVLREIGARLR